MSTEQQKPSIPREKIPPGCRWQDGTWHQPGIERAGEENRELMHAAAYYALADALTELVDASTDLDRAKQRHRAAINHVRTAYGRGEHIGGLPDSPWRIKGHIVRFVKGDPPYVVEPLSDMEPTP